MTGIFKTEADLLGNVASIAMSIFCDECMFKSFQMARKGSKKLEAIVKEACIDLSCLPHIDKCTPRMWVTFRDMIIVDVCKLMFIEAKARAPMQANVCELVSEENVHFPMDLPNFTVKSPMLQVFDDMLYPNTLTKENTMKATRPVMVDGINILETSDDTLVQIIRKAKAQIQTDQDMSEMSNKFKQKEKDLEEVIKLCLEQLDKERAEEL